MSEKVNDDSVVTRQPDLNSTPSPSEFVDYRPPTDGAQNEVGSPPILLLADMKI